MTEVLLNVALMAGVGTALLSRRWCLPITGFCLPLTRWLPSTSIAGLNATNLLLLAVVIHAMLAEKNPAPKEHRDPVPIPAIILMLFVLISLLRVQFSDEVPQLFLQVGGRYANIQDFKSIALCFLLYFSSRRLIRDSDTLRLTILGVMSACLLQVALAAAFFVAGVDPDHRAEGLMGESNVFGLFLATYVMLPIAAVMDLTRRLFLTSIPVVIAALMGILGTLSRGALVSAAGAVTAMALVRRTILIVVIAVVIASSPLWLPQSVLDRFGETKTTDRTGLSSVPGFESAENIDLNQETRIHLWRAGLRMAIANPLFGVGLNLFPYRLQQFGYHRRALHTHNQYLWLGAQCGISALLAHVAMLLGLGKIALRLALRREDTLGATFGLGMLGMVVSLAIGGMFLHGFYSISFCSPFLILAAIGVNHSFGSIEHSTT